MKDIKELSKNFIPVPQDSSKGKLIKMHVTPEEQIIDEQIRQLSQISNRGELTLEEIKKLDLLIKNKRLLNDQSTQNADFNVVPADTPVDQLLKLAEGSQDESGRNEVRSEKDPVE